MNNGNTLMNIEDRYPFITALYADILHDFLGSRNKDQGIKKQIFDDVGSVLIENGYSTQVEIVNNYVTRRTNGNPTKFEELNIREHLKKKLEITTDQRTYRNFNKFKSNFQRTKFLVDVDSHNSIVLNHIIHNQDNEIIRSKYTQWDATTGSTLHATFRRNNLQKLESHAIRTYTNINESYS